MKKAGRFFSILFIFSFCSSLFAELYPKRFEGQFEGWEQNRTGLISLFLPSDPVVLDAGGFYGRETLEFAREWPDGKIYSFEPNPHAFSVLRSKTRSFRNVQLANLALNDRSGTAPFYLCYGNTGKNHEFEGASSLLKSSPEMAINYQGPVIDVECVNLDDWCAANKIDRIDFMRLSLEGSELQVLRSAPTIVKKVTAIEVETNFSPFRIGTTQFQEMRDFLENSGFRLLTHWYRENLQGTAIFIKNSYFFNSKVASFLSNTTLDPDKYKKYYQPNFHTHYYLNDNEDAIKQVLKSGLPYEGNIGIIIDRLVRPGSVAVDVGAHIGVHTMTMSRKAGPQGAVVAFEAGDQMYLELLQNLHLNGCTNVIPICKALGETSKRAFLSNTLDGQTGGNQIKEKNFQGLQGKFVDIIPLDSLNLNNVSFMKVDIENYEYFFFKGAKETIFRNRPIILFECWIGADYDQCPEWEKSNFDRVMALLDSYGYEVYVIYSNDFIAFPSEPFSDQWSNEKKNFKRLDMSAFDLGLSPR